MNWQPLYLENEYVKLVPLGSKDFDILFSVACDPLIWEQHPDKLRYKKEVFVGFFNEAIKSHNAFLIFDKQSNTVIGSTRYYDYQKENSSIAIGYTFFARSYWGGHFNRMVKNLMINYAFQYVNKIVFHIGAYNIRSQLATTRLGAIKTKEFTITVNGIIKENFEYEIEKKNW